jgi:hypothetical protein
MSTFFLPSSITERPLHVITSVLPSQTASSSPSTVRQESQNCTLTSHTTGYLKIFFKKNKQDAVVCFSGLGTFDYKVDHIKKIETGNTRASWVYLAITGKQHRSPTSANEGSLDWPG